MDYKADVKTKEMANEVTERLEDLLKQKVECDYLYDADVSEKPDFIFKIYGEDNYKEVYVQQAEVPESEEYSKVDYYMSMVLEALNNEDYDEYTINSYERFIADKLNENGCSDLLIDGNKLYQKGNNKVCVYLENICTLYYNADEAVFLIETDDNIYDVDLDEEIIKLVSDEELKKLTNE